MTLEGPRAAPTLRIFLLSQPGLDPPKDHGIGPAEKPVEIPLLLVSDRKPRRLPGSSEVNRVGPAKPRPLVSVPLRVQSLPPISQGSK